MRRLLPALLLLFLVPRAATAQGSGDRAIALASFDTAWSRVLSFHYDTTFGGLDWHAVRRELRPQVERSPTPDRLRQVIRNMISRLGVSHYSLIPREVSEVMDPARRQRLGEGAPADAGLELRVAGDDVVIWRIDPEGSAARTGLRPGTAVLRVGEYDPVRGLREVRSLRNPRERHMALTRFLYGVNGLLRGDVGEEVRLVLRGGAGEETVTVPLWRSPGQLVRFGNVPASVVRATWRSEPAGPSCIGVIAFNVWLTPIAPEIDRAVDELRRCRGIVLDLRGNPGGVAGMVMGIGGHFVDSTRALGTMKMRGNELRFVVNPRRVNRSGEAVPVFGGRLAILMDAMSASTSEIFAAGLQATGRARVFGELSAGQALPALAARLPNGDVLMHAVADYLVVDGSRVEGRGVVPDEPVPLSAAALRAGRDAALEAAKRWILAPGS